MYDDLKYGKKKPSICLLSLSLSLSTYPCLDFEYTDTQLVKEREEEEKFHTKGTREKQVIPHLIFPFNWYIKTLSLLSHGKKKKKKKSSRSTPLSIPEWQCLEKEKYLLSSHKAISLVPKTPKRHQLLWKFFISTSKGDKATRKKSSIPRRSLPAFLRQ